MTLLLFFAGLLLLIYGASLLVQGASATASALNISPLVIGLTIVAFGTSSPELVVGIQSSYTGLTDLTLGTVVGSNIFNILFILGFSALILPLSISNKLLRLDVPVMIILSVVLWIFSSDGLVSKTEGGLLFAGLLLYMGSQAYKAKYSDDKYLPADTAAALESVNMRFWVVSVTKIVFGLILLYMGSGWFIDGAVSIATWMGVSELIIGLTIVAAGTSMPEVVTSVVAALRGERDIAVGNVIGSNIFNILGVVGISAFVAQEGLSVSNTLTVFDIPVMILVACACLPVFFTANVISRGEGVLFIGYYAAYTTYLVLAASHHAALTVYSFVMLWFVIPFTLFALLINVAQHLFKKK